MSDDLVKRLRKVEFWQADCDVRMQAAARIEELEDNLTTRLLDAVNGEHDMTPHGADVLQAVDRIEELEDALAKAMAVVEMIASADVDAVLGQAVDLSCEIIGDLMEKENG